ncbi:MAG: hypothetical protein P8Y52_04660 [Xanthomonadales bacterium]
MGFGFTPRKGFFEAVVLTAAIGGVLLFVTWQIASTPVAPDTRQLQSDIEFLSHELDALQARLARIQARNAVLERETDVLRQATRMLRDQESVRQADLNRLQSELDFFRRLAGTGGAQEGLDVYDVELRPTGSDRVYQFVVTLTQNIRRAAVVSGQVAIEIEGVRNDRPDTLGWRDLGNGEAALPAFRFKYFQQLEGYLTLPDGFEPTRLVLTLDARDRRSAVQRGYDWKALLDKRAAPLVE